VSGLEPGAVMRLRPQGGPLCPGSSDLESCGASAPCGDHEPDVRSGAKLRVAHSRRRLRDERILLIGVPHASLETRPSNLAPSSSGPLFPRVAAPCG